LIVLCWQDLAKQVVEQDEFLRRTGEDLQLMVDQLLQLEKMAVLEKSSREQSEKVKLLEARVETLEQDNYSLKDKTSKLQEKAKAAAKEKKCILFLLLCLSFEWFSSVLMFYLLWQSLKAYCRKGMNW
jgi:hypothetical protein